jgi:hypothetical protein
MMPGPVSDSYDPEYGTSADRHDVIEAIRGVEARITALLGAERKNIVGVVHGKAGRLRGLTLSEKELRILRYALDITRNIS